MNQHSKSKPAQSFQKPAQAVAGNLVVFMAIPMHAQQIRFGWPPAKPLRQTLEVNCVGSSKQVAHRCHEMRVRATKSFVHATCSRALNVLSS